MFFGLPRPCFVSPEILARELDEIFGANWVCAGPVPGPGPAGGDKPGSYPYFLFELGALSAIVVASPDGSVAAWHNVCRHRGTRMVTEMCGHLRNGSIQCPYHAWTYNAAGQLIGAPNMSETAGFDKSSMGLFPVRCAVWGNYVFLARDERAGAFEDFIRPLQDRLKNYSLGELRRGASRTYDVQANWKLLFQNYSECYHCPTVHPNLNTVTPYRKTFNDLGKGAVLGGPMELADGFSTVSRDGKPVSRPFETLEPVQRRRVCYYTVFPNWFVSAHPDYVMIHRLYPVDPGRTRVVCEFLVAKDTSEADLERAVSMWDEVNRQDWHVCELTQLGVQSPAYEPGPYSSLESMLVAFDTHYRSVFNIERETVAAGRV